MNEETRTPAKTSTGRQGFLAPFEDFERMLDDYFSNRWMRPLRFRWPELGAPGGEFEARMPSMDVIDRDGEIVVKAEIPGVDRKDIDVSVSGNTLTIKGETKKERKEEKEDYRLSEIRKGSFMRSVLLPAEVDIAKSEAKFTDGVLELTLPKTGTGKRKSIPVK